MQDRLRPCIHYVCAHETCRKNIVDVTLKKCKNCAKYRPRKAGKRQEPFVLKRQKDRDRHDKW